MELIRAMSDDVDGRGGDDDADGSVTEYTAD